MQRPLASLLFKDHLNNLKGRAGWDLCNKSHKLVGEETRGEDRGGLITIFLNTEGRKSSSLYWGSC